MLFPFLPTRMRKTSQTYIVYKKASENLYMTSILFLMGGGGVSILRKNFKFICYDRVVDRWRQNNIAYVQGPFIPLWFSDIILGISGHVYYIRTPFASETHDHTC